MKHVVSAPKFSASLLGVARSLGGGPSEVIHEPHVPHRAAVVEDS